MRIGRIRKKMIPDPSDGWEGEEGGRLLGTLVILDKVWGGRMGDL